MKRSPFSTSSHATEERLDPAIQAELDQLDAALRGQPIVDETLAALVRDVQATAPVMPSELRERLRDDVAEGFGRRRFGRPRGAGASAAGRTRGRSGGRLLSGGLAATFVVIALMGVGTAALVTQSEDQLDSMSVSETASGPISGGSLPSEDMAARAPEPMSAAPRSSESSGGGSASSAASGPTSTAAGGDSAPGGGSSPNIEKLTPKQRELVDRTLAAQAKARSAITSGGATPPTGTRRVEQSVEMRVRVKNGEIDEASQKVESIVRQGGGYVADSRVSMGTRGSGNALFSLKVASSKLDATMQRLADLGTVTRQQQASRDITSSFDSVQRRLSDNAEVRRALSKALAKAETAGQIASLKSRLADNRRTRESLERQLAQLRTRTDLTDIALTLRAPSSESAASEDDDGSWSIGDAVSDAGTALGTVTGVLLVGGAILLPFALLGAAGWAVYRMRRKRRREAALDA